MKRRTYSGLVAMAAVALVATACGSSAKSTTPTTAATSGGTPTTASSGGAALTSSAPGVTPTTIKIGYITSLTGVASSTFADGLGGAQARIALQNAQGGVDGRKLVLVPLDDASSPTSDATAAQELVSKGVFGIADFSSFTFGGTTYLSAHHVPVTGFGFDGPEWAEPASSNMFSWSPVVDTPIQGTEYGYATDAETLKAAGVTKLAALGYGISNSSQTSIHAIMTAAESLGIKRCYENLSVPFGGVDFTADVLSIKQAGCDGVVGSFVDASDLALSGAIKQSNLPNVKQMYFTGYDSQIQDSASARAEFAGDYVAVSYDPDSTNPAVEGMFNALKQYDTGFKAGGIPDLGLYGSYLSVDEMIYGLQQAGRNPTQTGFISTMRDKVTSYNAGGLLATPIGFTGFGTASMVPPQLCQQVASIQGTKFVLSNGGKEVCGNRIVINPSA